jgi:N-acetylmuramoyl-L-alanine amidase
LPGTVQAEAGGARVVYQEGSRQAVLTAEPPYALRNGYPLENAPPTRVLDGRLAVSESFLLERASELLGRRMAVEKVHRTGFLRIVLDPGHGGPDIGTRGGGALEEKSAMLTLARDVAAKLRRKGYEVRLTRDGDRTLPAVDRAAAANGWDADLFLSLHASGTGRPLARGFELFVAPAPPSGADPRLWHAGQVGKIEESRRWAEVLRSNLSQALPTFDRGIVTLPSPLLEAVTSPACLLEVANLSFPDDADILLRAQTRSELASAIARAADEFFRWTSPVPPNPQPGATTGR